jgi:hypothetical protein
VLGGCSLQASKRRPPKLSKELLWPIDSSDADWFVREQIPVPNSLSLWERVRVRELAPDTLSSQPSRKERGSEELKALWIAKADALPDDWQVAADQVVWVSGVQTWKRLARRGVWVNGCAESLGEQELPGIETLMGAPLNWIKLTHEGGFADGEMPLTATYRLVARNGNPDLKEKRYFFWKSGSSFEHALSLNPWIREMTHFCGPGNTQRILEKKGYVTHRKDGRAFVFLPTVDRSHARHRRRDGRPRAPAPSGRSAAGEHSVGLAQQPLAAAGRELPQQR